jgi:hypothetical protein
MPPPIQRTEHAPPTSVEHVRVHLRGGHVLVPEQFLHRADVVAGLEQVRGERMPQRVAARRLGDAGRAHGPRHRALQPFFVDVVAANRAVAGIARALHRREQVLPRQFARRVRILARQRMRQVHADPRGVQVLAQHLAHARQLLAQRLGQARRQHGA